MIVPNYTRNGKQEKGSCCSEKPQKRYLTTTWLEECVLPIVLGVEIEIAMIEFTGPFALKWIVLNVMSNTSFSGKGMKNVCVGIYQSSIAVSNCIITHRMRKTTHSDDV